MPQHRARVAAIGKTLSGALLLLYLGLMLPRAFAQTAVPEDPAPGPLIHIVAEGENLTLIADQYDVTVAQLQLVNQLKRDDILTVGRELVVPGGDVRPAAVVYTPPPGKSVRSIATGFDIPVDELLVQNRAINREYVPALGQAVALMSSTGQTKPEPLTGVPHIVQSGETLLELAARYGKTVPELIRANDLSYPVRLFAGQRLRIPGDEVYNDLPGQWADVRVRPERAVQGNTAVIYVENLLPGTPVGEFADRPLRFMPQDAGFAALIGLDAFTPPGYYPVEIGGSGEHDWYPFEQQVPIGAAAFPTQVITVPMELSDLLDPSIRSAEDQFLSQIYSNFTEEKQWDGLFQVPVTDTVVTAPYGGGRSYNEGPVTIFHTGTDFNGNIGTPILAAANGNVVFNDDLELRGKTVIVDHGWGVMTGYYHLSESNVELGQQVSAGQQIGLGGSSGLSTGPHLHWELRVMDVPVDGMSWTTELFP